MMGDHDNAKLDHENHLILDQPLLRLPVELLRKNTRAATFAAEWDGAWIKQNVKETATAAVHGTASQASVLGSLDALLARARGVKRKLAACAAEEARLLRHERARLAHLAELYAMHGVDDVRYEGWSRTRLDRLLVDYLLRNGYHDSAALLARERGVEDLVDVDTFRHVSRVRASLKRGSVAEALAWCTAGDTKKELRRMDSNLEFTLRFQQYIELVRPYTLGSLLEAIRHAQRYLQPFRATHAAELHQACGLLAVPPDRADAYPVYRALYAPRRWDMLADLFTQTHNALLALPPTPPLHMALSSGLSALKTPSCHPSQPAAATPHPSSSSSSSTTQNPAAQNPATTTTSSSVCPICSTELNELARNVPYAHHMQSQVDHDLVLLPNGRAYGRGRLDEYAKKSGLLEGHVKDLRTGEVFGVERLKKIFIT